MMRQMDFRPIHDYIEEINAQFNAIRTQMIPIGGYPRDGIVTYNGYHDLEQLREHMVLELYELGKCLEDGLFSHLRLKITFHIAHLLRQFEKVRQPGPYEFEIRILQFTNDCIGRFLRVDLVMYFRQLKTKL